MADVRLLNRDAGMYVVAGRWVAVLALGVGATIAAPRPALSSTPRAASKPPMIFRVPLAPLAARTAPLRFTPPAPVPPDSGLPYSGPTSSTIPFTLDHGIPVINVQVNGKSARFVLDSGAVTPALISGAARRLGLKVETGPIEGHKTFYGAPVRTAVVGRLRIGSFLILGMQMIVHDSFAIKGVDGIIGMSIFDCEAGLFDFSSSQFTLWTHGNLSADERAAVGMDGAVAIPWVQPTEDVLGTFPVKFGTLPAIPCILDTGSLSSSVSASLVRRVGLKPYAHMMTHSMRGWQRSLVVRLPRIAVGGTRLADPAAFYSSEAGVKGPPTLGISALTGCRVLLDMPAGKLYVKRVSPLSAKPFKPTWTVSRVPMKVRLDVPKIGVTLPDGKIHWFGFTLDDPNNTLDSEVAAELGLKPKPIPGIPGAQSVVMTVRLGSTKPKSLDFLLGKVHENLYLGPGVDGVLGVSELQSIGLQIDVSHGVAEAIQPGIDGLMPLPPEGWEEVPLTPAENGKCQMPIKLDGKSILSLPAMDNPVTLVGNPNGHPLSLRPAVSTNVRWPGPPALCLERLHTFKIGSDTWQAPMVFQYTPTKSGKERVPDVIGWEVLARYDLLIEPGLEVLYIHKDPDCQPDPYPRWQGVGLVWERNNGDEVVAREILDPSPASEVGLQPGEVIMAINGKDVRTVDDRTVAKLLENPHGSKVTLTLRRAGAPGPIRVSMIPRELLTGRIKASHTKK